METLRRKDVAKLLGVKVSTIDSWLAKGYLPRPMRLGRLPVWDKAEIEEWARNRKEVR